MHSHEKSEKTPIPDYLEYFRLEADPFEENCVEFFDEGLRGDQFAQLLHLAQFSDALLGVVGQAGSGKKTFQRELVARLAPEDIVIEIKVPLLTDAFDLISEVSAKFGLDSSSLELNSKDGSTAIFELIHQLIEYGGERTEDDALKILIIEDAHNLDEQALKALTSLSIHQLENQRSIHVVMLGEIELSERLIELENEKLLVQVFELEPLSKEELKLYLRFRLDAVGFEGIFPYKSDDIDFLWGVSRGVPEDVHEPARDILIELSSPPPEVKSIGLPIPHMALIVILVAGLLAALFYRSSSVPDIEESALPIELAVAPENIPKKIIPRADFLESKSSDAIRNGEDEIKDIEEGVEIKAQNKLEDMMAVEKKDATLYENSLASSGSSSVGQAQRDERKSLKKPSSDPVKEITNSDVFKKTKGDVELSVKPSDQISKQAKQEEPLSAEQELIAQASRSKLTEDESKLMSMPDDVITLQLLAGGSQKAAEDFVIRQANQEDLFVYSAIRSGKTLYIVVEGSYKTTALAKKSINSLPADQQKAGPWPRTLTSVKADIRQFRGL
ncbi:MAG: AAA family ATPase [Cellvibrionaceae bacterium]